MTIESQAFRAVLNYHPYDKPVVGVEGSSPNEAVEKATARITHQRKSGLALTISRVEQLVLVNGKETYRTVNMN